MEAGDKVRATGALWGGHEIGTISSVVKIENSKRGDWIHVIFPETDKHYAYRQSFYSKDLLLMSKKK